MTARWSKPAWRIFGSSPSIRLKTAMAGSQGRWAIWRWPVPINRGLDVTDWLEWFLACLLRAVQGSEETLAQVLAKARFWQHWAGVPMNDRQMLSRHGVARHHRTVGARGSQKISSQWPQHQL